MLPDGTIQRIVNYGGANGRKSVMHHLSVEQQIDHRSYARQGKLEIPTIHEGADARKIDEKFQSGQVQTASWKVEENQIIKRQNALLKKIQIPVSEKYLVHYHSGRSG